MIKMIKPETMIQRYITYAFIICILELILIFSGLNLYFFTRYGSGYQFLKLICDLFILGILIWKGISKPCNSFMTQLKDICSTPKDLSKRIRYRNKSEFSKGANELNSLLDQFRVNSYRHVSNMDQGETLIVKEQEIILDIIRSFPNSEQLYSSVDTSAKTIPVIIDDLFRAMEFDSKQSALINRLKKESENISSTTIETKESFASMKESILIMDSILQETEAIKHKMNREMKETRTFNFYELKSKDNKSLVQEPQALSLPSIKRNFHRPENPEKLAKTDSRYWYDNEFSGWGVDKKPLPLSPKNGPGKKRVAILRMQSFPHGYYEAFERGASKIAEHVGIEAYVFKGNSYYTELIKNCIKFKPDLAILFSENSEKITSHISELHRNGIPVITANSMPDDDGSQYILSSVCHDNWLQGRVLARKFAESMSFSGGYTILRHHPKTAKFISLTYSVITELNKIAPNMKCLDHQLSIEEDTAQEICTEWLRCFGSELKGIIAADSGDGLVGINSAISDYNRNDIIQMAFGNSQIGMQYLKEGKVKLLIPQSGESEGAIAMKTAVDWFCGLEIPPIITLPIQTLSKDEVDDFLPAQW
jgi:ribose transport system substrate-binding protein